LSHTRPLSSLLISPFHHLYLSLFFFLLLPPPPISTLFPYTTLFRSLQKKCSIDHSVYPLYTHRSLSILRSRNRSSKFPLSIFHRDRKSTRLNSSHDQISYAVFCLKKKNKKNYINYKFLLYR